MVTLFKKIIHAPLVGWRWSMAIQNAARNDYSSALVNLNYLSDFFDNNNIEFHLLKGICEFGNGDNERSVTDFEIAINLLKEGLNKYTQFEKKYLTAYALVFGGLANKNLSESKKSSAFSEVLWKDVDLTKVRKHLKQKFPLRRHPNWE